MNKIAKLTAFDLFMVNQKRLNKLWKVREQSAPRDWEEIQRSHCLLSMDAEDFKEVLARYSWL